MILPLTRRDLPSTPLVSKWDRDATWNTHAARIFLAEHSSLVPRFQELEGSRRVAWMSVLDVACPVCSAGKDTKCVINVVSRKLFQLLDDFRAGKLSEEALSYHLGQGWSR